MSEFSLENYASEAEQLLDRTKTVFESFDLPVDALPDNMQPEDGPIKLVFVGQYSSGKSSIIKMLSGIDTGIGAGIMTQQAHTYKWHDLEIVDTPGIQTGIREDHDQITYEEISHAALLIFVITNEGFDRKIGEHFRQLAVEQKRGDNMILIVNKMDRAAEGNSPEQQEVMQPDIEQVIAPYTMQDMHVSFISTQSYEEAMQEQDPDLRQELLAESGYENLVANLNAFVAEHKVAGRLAGPVYTLESVLRQNLATPMIKETMDADEALVRRKLDALLDAKQDCLEEMQGIAGECQTDIIAIGRNTAQDVMNAQSEDEAKDILTSAGESAEKIRQQGNEKMQAAFGKMVEHVQVEWTKRIPQDFVHPVELLAETNQTDENTVLSVLENQDVQDLGKKLITNAQKPTDGAKVPVANAAGIFGEKTLLGQAGSLLEMSNAGLKEFAGSNLHNLVKEAGGALGIKFAPWGAVQTTKYLAMFGKVLGVLGVLHQLYAMLKGEEKRAEAQAKQREAKDAIKVQFDEWGKVVYSEMMESARKVMHQYIDPQVEQVEHNLQAFQETRDRAEQISDKLQELLEAEQKLVGKLA